MGENMFMQIWDPAILIYHMMFSSFQIKRIRRRSKVAVKVSKICVK